MVRDPPGTGPSVPGILGMNVIRRCYKELFGAYGPTLFNLPAVAQAPGPVIEALQRCHHAAARATGPLVGSVNVRGP